MVTRREARRWAVRVVVAAAAVTAAVGSSAAAPSDWVSSSPTLDGTPAKLTVQKGELRALFNGSWGGLNYSRCSASCGDGASWDELQLHELSIEVWNARAVFSDSGAVAAVAVDINPSNHLHFVACPSSCEKVAFWTQGDLGVSTSVGLYDLQADGAGGFGLVSVSTSSANPARQATFATCAVACTDPGHWTQTLLGVDGVMRVALAFDGVRPRVLIEASDGSKLTTVFLQCDQDCSNPASWNRATFDGADQGLALEVTGHRIDAVWSKASGLEYRSCSSSCTTASGWSRPLALAADRTGSPVLESAANQLELAYFSYNGANIPTLHYASCPSQCELAQGWTDTPVGPQGRDVGYLTMAHDGSQPRLMFQTQTPPGAAEVRYAHCDAPCGPPGPRPVTPTTGGRSTPLPGVAAPPAAHAASPQGQGSASAGPGGADTATNPVASSPSGSGSAATRVGADPSPSRASPGAPLSAGDALPPARAPEQHLSSALGATALLVLVTVVVPTIWMGLRRRVGPYGDGG